MADEDITPTPAERPHRAWLAWLAALCSLAAWIALHFNATATAILCAISLIAAIAALRQQSRAAHNLALTALVASAILALVLIIVALALYTLLG